MLSPWQWCLQGGGMSSFPRFRWVLSKQGTYLLSIAMARYLYQSYRKFFTPIIVKGNKFWKMIRNIYMIWLNIEMVLIFLYYCFIYRLYVVIIEESKPHPLKSGFLRPIHQVRRFNMLLINLQQCIFLLWKMKRYIIQLFFLPSFSRPDLAFNWPWRIVWKHWKTRSLLTLVGQGCC